ncbi:nitrogenase-stabilizing/protective protein NifW [Vibrio sp. PP-XX7]
MDAMSDEVILSGEVVSDDVAFDELETVEDFLRYFQIPFDQALVQRKRIALLRFYQHVLQQYTGPMSRTQYRHALKVAYRQVAGGREIAFDVHGCKNCTQCDD